MSTKLDHLYGSAGEISTLNTKITNLSNIAVKNNIANQVLPQQKINNPPTDSENIIRLQDTEYVRVINHESQITANTHAYWTPAGWNLENDKIHHFIVKFEVNNIKHVFDWETYIVDKNSKNMGPIFIFGVNETDFNETCKLKIWIDGDKLRILCSQEITNFIVYFKKGFKR